MEESTYRVQTPRRILLVEDDPNDIELTLKALADHHPISKVDVVRDGAEALDYLLCRGTYVGRSTGAPAVTLLDIKMPKVDGLEVLQRIRDEPELRLIPVVILTSSPEDADVLRSYELGVNAYVVKPVDWEHFMDAIKGVGVFWVDVNEPPPTSASGADANAV